MLYVRALNYLLVVITDQLLPGEDGLVDEDSRVRILRAAGCRRAVRERSDSSKETD